MTFKSICSLVFYSLLLLLTACSDPENETDLVDLFSVASLDIIAIDFPVENTQDIVAINTFVDYEIEGLKTNGINTIPITDHIRWSLSAGAVSRIDQNGRFSSGSVAETVMVTAQVGYLSTSLQVTVSAAKFDRVIQLSNAPVQVNMCQQQQIKPLGSYLNDDGTEEIRLLDNSIINSITWIIRNAEDDSPSQRAYIATENNVAMLQALEAGNVIIQARAISLSSGNEVTSDDFNQTLDHNLNSLKLCLKSETDLASCTLSNASVAKDNVSSLIAVGNYQAADGSSFNRNISAFSKWGIDNVSNATILFSADRKQLDLTGNIAGTTANISVACGNIEQFVLDSEIKNGVVLSTDVTCDSSNLNCLRATAAINITEATVTSLTVTANGTALVDNTALNLALRPAKIVFNVTANFSDNTSQDITTDTNVIYNNRNALVIIAIAGSPGQYTVRSNGNADVQIIYQGQVFTALITLPIPVEVPITGTP